MRHDEWRNVNDELPDNGVLVECLLDKSRVIEPLKRNGRLWFVADGTMYVYYTPTHWRPIQKEKSL